MINVELGYIKHAGPKQTAIANDAINSLNYALNHPDFKSRLLNAYFKELMFQPKGGPERRITPIEAYEKLVDGAELGGVVDGVITINVKLKKYRHVGVWNFGDDYFTTAYWVINRAISAGNHIGLAANFIHEWCHVAGFRHHPNNNARDDMPYNLGNIVSDLLRERIAEENGINKSLSKKLSAPYIHDFMICGAEAEEEGETGTPDMIY